MRITRLYLRSFRVFGDELDLQVPAGLVGIYGVNGAGKCLPGSTRVWDPDTGEGITIEQFVRERRKSVVGYEGGTVKPVEVIDWLDLGPKPIVRVTLASGASIDAATTHPLLTDRGCVCAGDLVPGDWVAETRRIPQAGMPLLTDEEALIIGLLLGDGALTHTPKLCAADPDIAAAFRDAVEKTFPGLTTRLTCKDDHIVVSKTDRRSRSRARIELARRLSERRIDLRAYVGSNATRIARGEASPSWETLDQIEDDHGLDLLAERCALHGGRVFTEWLRELEMFGCDSFTKRVPRKFLMLPEGQVRHLVAGLLLSDGYVNDRDLTGSAEVSYTTRSQQLARDVRILFLRLGLTSSIRVKKVHGKPAFTVSLTSDAIRRAGDLPLVGKKADRLRGLVARLGTVAHRPLHDLIPPSFCASLPLTSRSGRSRSRRQMADHAMSREVFLDFGGGPSVANADVCWSRVVEVENLNREEMCFDITVDSDEHLYLAETFIVHNSALVESIRWSLWGKARTPKDEVRTTGVNTDCVTEVEFEHEGHLYLVRRTLTGANSTQRAEAHWNGAQVAEGVTDVRRYVESVLGMDDQSFRASVFAEQKQVSSFSDVTADKRRELVLRLLGITPLERARDLARTDARDRKRLHEQLQTKLPDLDEQRAALAVAEDAATARDAQAKTATESAAAAVAERDAAEASFESLDEVRRAYEEMVNEGRGMVERLNDAKEQRERLEREQVELATAATRVAELRPLTDGLADREHRLSALRRVDAAEHALAAIPAVDPVDEPDETPLDDARRAFEEATAAAGDVAGALRGARAELERAEAAASRSASLSADEDCPMCGQALGDAFEQVQTHRRDEVDAAAARVRELETQHRTTTKTQAAAKKAVDDAQAALKEAQQAWARHQEHAGRRAAAERAVDVALAELDAPPKKSELATLTKAVDAGKQAASELAKLEGRLERAATVETELAAVVARIDQLAEAADELRAKVKALAFDAAKVHDAKAARDAARAAADRLAKQAADAQLLAAKTGAAVDGAKEKLAAGEAAHAEMKELVEEVRHTARVADLLSEFRNTVVQTIGPQLAMQAADLFAELTDHEYDQLDVNPDTFDIRISDAGVEHGLARFSGSETDLANLALRIAISEHVRFQSGGAVGLLVLDEVFGPLDPDRKERMLQALNRLGGRFRQVLVITHDADIKEQLPSAIEVVKLPGRRATARVLSGI